MHDLLTNIEHAFIPLVSARDMDDELVLKDGQTLNGTLVSCDTSKLIFDIQGQKLTFSTAMIKNINFCD
jgi:hypothetical protein